MIIKQLWYIWHQKQLAVQVAALALYLLLAFVPFVSLLTGVAGSLFGRPDIRANVIAYIDRLGEPALTTAAEQLLVEVHGFGSGDVFTLFFSLFILLYGANGAFLQLRNAINNIQLSFTGSKQAEKVTWLNAVQDFAIGFIAIFVTLMGIVTAAILSPIVSWLSSNTLEQVVPQTALILQLIINLFFVALVFVPLYKIIGRHSISWKASFVGGLVVSIGNLLTSLLLGVYFDFTAPRSTFSLASTITILITWLMLLATTIVVGGLIANYFHFTWHKSKQEA